MIELQNPRSIIKNLAKSIERERKRQKLQQKLQQKELAERSSVLLYLQELHFLTFAPKPKQFLRNIPQSIDNRC